RQGRRRDGPRAAGALQGKARALQIPALDRVPPRAAEDRDRQDPALQAQGRKRPGVSAALGTSSIPLTAALVATHSATATEAGFAPLTARRDGEAMRKVYFGRT